jgi:hypothetical protein
MRQGSSASVTGWSSRRSRRHAATLDSPEAFEDQCAWLAVNTSKTAICALMRIAWRTVGRICERVSDEPKGKVDRFAGLQRLGFDEISVRKGSAIPDGRGRPSHPAGSCGRTRVQPTFRLASRLRLGGGQCMGACGTVRHFPVVTWGRGAQIHLGPPESQGSGGAVPRPLKGGFPRPKLDRAYVLRLRRITCRRRTLCPGGPRYRQRSAAALCLTRRRRRRRCSAKRADLAGAAVVKRDGKMSVDRHQKCRSVASV